MNLMENIIIYNKIINEGIYLSDCYIVFKKYKLRLLKYSEFYYENYNSLFIKSY
jgi:hypothetical protein